jgi:hypothetical protein
MSHNCLYLFPFDFSTTKECYKALYSVQKKLPPWAKVLPEIKHLQRAQYSFNAYMEDIIPIKYEAD